MTRPLRHELAGGLYHVTSRGDRREPIYHDDKDRQAWLEILGDTCDRFNWQCHSWCQMTNHYHLIIETPDANLSRGMRHLNGVYTQYINRTHRRVGHVFQGRYKGIIVERDAYLLELARYVPLNPVRAGMVDSAGDWVWSSYNAMIGVAKCPVWLMTDWILRQFSEDPQQAAIGFARFVHAGIGAPSVWENLIGQIYLAREDYIRSLQDNAFATRLTGTSSEVARRQRRPLAQPLSAFVAGDIAGLADGPRASRMAAAYGTGHFTMQEIADAFGVHYATVSRAVNQRQTSRP